MPCLQRLRVLLDGRTTAPKRRKCTRPLERRFLSFPIKTLSLHTRKRQIDVARIPSGRVTIEDNLTEFHVIPSYNLLRGTRVFVVFLHKLFTNGTQHRTDRGAGSAATDASRSWPPLEEETACVNGLLAHKELQCLFVRKSYAHLLKCRNVHFVDVIGSFRLPERRRVTQCRVPCTSLRFV